MGDDPRPPALPGETPDAYVRRVTAPLGSPALPAGRATTDELKLLGPTGKAAVQGARTLVRVLTIAVPALLAAVLAVVQTYQSLVDQTRTAAQAVKNKSEAGYQVTKEGLQAIERRQAELEETVRQLAGQQHPPARRGSRPRPPGPTAVPPPARPPKPLPGDLDQAARQVYKPAASPLPSATDAGVTGR